MFHLFVRLPIDFTLKSIGQGRGEFQGTTRAMERERGSQNIYFGYICMYKYILVANCILYADLVGLGRIYTNRTDFYTWKMCIKIK